MDAVGNINGVPVYEFDLDGLKVEEKPWRKPGMQFFYLYIFKLYLLVILFLECMIFLFLDLMFVRGSFMLLY